MPVVLLSKPLLNHSARKSARFVGAENSLAGLSRWLPICRAVGNPCQFVNLTWGDAFPGWRFLGNRPAVFVGFFL